MPHRHCLMPRLRQIALALGTVLPRWLQRCHTRCAEVWNQTLGPVHGILVASAP